MADPVPNVATPPPAAFPSRPVPPPLPPKVGAVEDAGPARHDAVRATRWNTRGPAKVLGDVEVDTAHLNGLTTIRGRLTADRIESEGTLDVVGGTNVPGSLVHHGSASFHATVKGGDVTLEGITAIEGDLIATGTVRATGSLTVTGQLSAGRFEFDGQCTIGGDVTATEVVGRLAGESQFTNLIADRVALRRTKGLRASGRASLESIEAHQVELEGVRAERVRSERVLVGPGCLLASVDGEIVRVHPSSRVGPVSVSDPPYGLSR
jgi:cytoskeletal protein CcmA (bactofilin family)